MKYDFGKYVERRGTDSSKWDHQTGPFGAEGLLPFWVADLVIQPLRKIITVQLKTGQKPAMVMKSKKIGLSQAPALWAVWFSPFKA